MRFGTRPLLRQLHNSRCARRSTSRATSAQFLLNTNILKAGRTAAGLTQREVGAMLNVESVRISEIERDVRKHFETRDRYAHLLKELAKDPE